MDSVSDVLLYIWHVNVDICGAAQTDIVRTSDKHHSYSVGLHTVYTEPLLLLYN